MPYAQEEKISTCKYKIAYTVVDNMWYTGALWLLLGIWIAAPSCILQAAEANLGEESVCTLNPV